MLTRFVIKFGEADPVLGILNCFRAEANNHFGPDKNKQIKRLDVFNETQNSIPFRRQKNRDQIEAYTIST